VELQQFMLNQLGSNQLGSDGSDYIAS